MNLWDTVTVFRFYLHILWWKGYFRYKEEARSSFNVTVSFNMNLYFLFILRYHLSRMVQTILHQWWLSCTIFWQTIISRIKNSLRPLNFTCTTFVFVRTGQYYWFLLHIIHSSHFLQYWKADNKRHLFWFQEFKTPKLKSLQSIIIGLLYN